MGITEVLQTTVTFYGIFNMPYSCKKYMLVSVFYSQINGRFISIRQCATIVLFPFLYIFLLENTWTTRADRNWQKLGTTRAAGVTEFLRVAIVCGCGLGHIDQGHIVQEFSFGDTSVRNTLSCHPTVCVAVEIIWKNNSPIPIVNSIWLSDKATLQNEKKGLSFM